jgi:hypothetical protein
MKTSKDYPPLSKYRMLIANRFFDIFNLQIKHKKENHWRGEDIWERIW